MNSAERGVVLHCLKSMIDEAACEECPLYGMTGTDHCEKDCVRLAINALEQEPCTDAISRQAAINVAIDAVDDWDGGCNLSREEYIRKALETIPPVTTEKVGKWIPCEKRLPDKLQDVLITFYDAEGEYDVAYMRKTFNASYKAQGSENEWVSSMGETTYADYEVSAWMPIEPYKASPTGAEGGTQHDG